MSWQEAIASYETWHLQFLLKDKEKYLFALEFCTCDTCITESPEETARRIDETRELLSLVRAELQRRNEL